jgi:hypothetical protein
MDDGLVVNGNKIKIDLNGKRISGDGGAGDIGIDNTVNDNSNLTVRNGVVKGFGIGIHSQGDRTTLTKLTVAGNSTDGAFLDGDKHIVKGNLFAGNLDDGVAIEAGTASIITANTAARNAYGIFLNDDATGNSVTKNKSNGNNVNGIRIDGDANSITKNSVDGNGDGDTTSGLLMFSTSQSNSSSKNVITGSGGDGYEDLGTSNRVTKSTARGNGFFVVDGTGGGFDAGAATTPSGSGNKASGNDNGGAPCNPASLCS